MTASGNRKHIKEQNQSLGFNETLHVIALQFIGLHTPLAPGWAKLDFPRYKSVPICPKESNKMKLSYDEVLGSSLRPPFGI